jgi:thiamine biosynthesis lipoprotein
MLVGVMMAGAQALFAQGNGLTRFTFTEYHMGIQARIVLYARDEAAATTACKAAYKRIEDLEAIMSDYRKDSELMQLCARAGQGPQWITRDLFRVLSRSKEIATQSGGAFDITVGPVIQLWRAARKETRLPDPGLLASAMRLVGIEKLKLDPLARTAELTVPGMRLDLGGIGKGFASDEALKVLRNYGVRSALIEMGGDLVLGDAPPGTRGWVVNVPNAGGKDLSFSNCAVSSSGDTEQFLEIAGVRYSHVVDPKTGQALTRRVQATVVAANGFTSDPLSTALTVMAPEDRPMLLRHYPCVQTFIRMK